MHIAFIGFGEAAQAFCDSLRAADPTLRFSAYDILIHKEGQEGACAKAMEKRAVRLCTQPGEAVTAAEWIISAVTADQSYAAAQSVAPELTSRQVLFDINSVSPERKRRTAALIQARNARYIDMAVMAPVHPKGHRTPVILAGEIDDALCARLRALGFDFTVASADVGAATAVKMVRSLFVKGVEAISVELVLAGSAAGCLDQVLSSLARSYPGLDLPKLALYNMERMLKHGRRRAAEMRESAATLDDLGLAGDLARAVAALHDRMGALPEDGANLGGLHEATQRVLALRNATLDKSEIPQPLD